MSVATPGLPSGQLPAWVPQNAVHYLQHTALGVPIRRLARRAGVEASTVSRQIRKLEALRDDPLIDAALCTLDLTPDATPKTDEEVNMLPAAKGSDPDPEIKSAFDEKALRVLRRLGEAGAVLAVATDMDKAVVVRDDNAGGSVRTAVVEVELAQALALKEWIHCDAPGRICRYHITSAGRSACQKLLAEQENSARGFAEAAPEFAQARPVSGKDKPRRGALNAEPPLVTLARRRDKDGTPFLTADLVGAGERLREDFELSQMSPRVTQNWDSFLTAGASSPARKKDPMSGAAGARVRFETALAELGPGLGDIALRCCCYLEGLEATEKRMGWSSRSGKIVLRIALQRLRRHYEKIGDAGNMIG